VQTGEKVLTSGGDQIFPKGLLVGTVSKVAQGKEFFLDVTIKPAADLSKLEEVLVITKEENRTPETAENTPVRAVDILEKRLPFVPDKPVVTVPGAASGTGAGTLKSNGAGNVSKTNVAKPEGVLQTEGVSARPMKAAPVNKPASSTPTAAPATPSSTPAQTDTAPAGEPPQ